MINNARQLSRSLVGIYHWRKIKYERFGGRPSVGGRPVARAPGPPKSGPVLYRIRWQSAPVFTARCYASAVLAMALWPSVRLSVRPSQIGVLLKKKRRITQTTPHNSPGSLVFWCQRSPRNSTGVTSYEGAECRWGGSKSATFDK